MWQQSFYFRALKDSQTGVWRETCHFMASIQRLYQASYLESCILTIGIVINREILAKTLMHHFDQITVESCHQLENLKFYQKQCLLVQKFDIDQVAHDGRLLLPRDISIKDYKFHMIADK